MFCIEHITLRSDITFVHVNVVVQLWSSTQYTQFSISKVDKKASPLTADLYALMPPSFRILLKQGIQKLNLDKQLYSPVL